MKYDKDNIVVSAANALGMGWSNRIGETGNAGRQIGGLRTASAKVLMDSSSSGTNNMLLPLPWSGCVPIVLWRKGADHSLVAEVGTYRLSVSATAEGGRFILWQQSPQGGENRICQGTEVSVSAAMSKVEIILRRKLHPY